MSSDQGLEIKAIENYKSWLQDPMITEETKQELRSIENDAKEIEDRFYKDLEFGTGGLRGVIGAGTNRINIYTVGKATQGLAQFILESQSQNATHEKSAVIAYDSRHQSPEFALEAALVLAGNGIKAYLYESLRTTPELSFAVRELKATAGIVITASHNPPEYNGYKAYGSDGGQLIPGDAKKVIHYIRQIDSLDQVKKSSKDEAEKAQLLISIGKEMDKKFIQAITSVSLNTNTIKQMSEPLKVVFTPLHGTGNIPVRESLKQIGITEVHVVKEQELPDPNFTTVKSPNPEEKDAFALAIQKADEIQADIIVGTDPDCDRMGAVVKNKQGSYEVLTGNQAGALILNYLLSNLKEQGELPDNGVMIKTIVTSELGEKIASYYGLKTLNTLTGFKYIGEKMTQFEKTGEATYVFGYEESYGYLAGTHARDKDAVVASMLICEAAAYYKSQGKTLYDVLFEIYEQFGTFLEVLHSRTLKGKAGMEQIQTIMNDWRTNPPQQLMNTSVTEVLDYEKGINELPKENVLKYKLADGSWFCLRPSGTEPKIKVYIAVNRQSKEEAQIVLDQLSEVIMNKVDGNKG
ncbi:phospho-sugar mutase [Chengkuizengella sediminis]|uniref:phospho-sugar mutase n=1 Tax=Chengkuizengella sediminis TaxID=1885917 RepID=UPI001389A063|nr:phospho-sugar mutase [Chengkuizengella sediminis]NDI34781.1 phospho-sugar mutase [Chengkuizengella sediminis]